MGRVTSETLGAGEVGPGLRAHSAGLSAGIQASARPS